MIILKSTTETLEVATSTTSAIDVSVSYADLTSTTLTGGSQETAITTATTTTILSAPAASTQRQVKFISIENKGSASNAITIKKDISATEYIMYSATLKAGESLQFAQEGGFSKHSSNGEDVTTVSSDKSAPINARSFNFMKIGPAVEAAGILHFLGSNTGSPGVWATGTPGLNGRATDGTTAADLGCFPIKNASTGSNFITQFMASATTACAPMLIDLLWVNTGLVVTTLTAQAITPVALPARDAAGTTNGDDVQMGLLVTGATTNAAAITNCTASYTDQDGNAGATATMASFPATAVAGTLVPFQLATGDTGVRSVQSVTLGTSLVAGAVSLVLFRIVAGVPVLVANSGGQLNSQQKMNVRLYNGACILPIYMPSATTATNFFGTLNVEEK